MGTDSTPMGRFTSRETALILAALEACYVHRIN
jgi:hypothetical protein